MSDTPEAIGDLPSSTDVLRSARAALSGVGHDADMAGLALADPGAPVLVRTLAGRPSYWLVPLRSNDRTVGFVRVTGSGVIGAIGRFGGASALDLDADGVAARVADRLAADETSAEPVLVHDGPPGREAWMVVTRIGGTPARCLFVTPAGLYERAVGDARPPAFEQTDGDADPLG